MASTTVTRGSPGAWLRIAFAMFAVGWGANQFSPMLIVYRHELRLTAGEVAGLFLVYALTLIPGLLVGGPASDRFGRRPVVWPFAALSPLATLLLVLGPRSLAVIAADRVLAGLAAVLLGLAYGLCLVSGLRQAEHMAGPDERGAVIACYYALAYLGFAVPYLAAGLGALAGKTGAFVALTVIIARSRCGPPGTRPACAGLGCGPKVAQVSGGRAETAIRCHGKVTPRLVRIIRIIFGPNGSWCLPPAP